MIPPRKPGTHHFLIMVGVSLVTHIALVVFLNLNPWLMIIKVRPMAYTVTLIPVSLPKPEIPKIPVPPVSKEDESKTIEKVKPAEKSKPIVKPKKDNIIEKVKKKERDEESLKRIQEAMEEVRKKVALDEIRKKVARSEPVEEKPPIISPPKTSSALEFKLEEYYNKVVENKIKEEWTIPENLLKDKEWVDLETIIIIIIERDGKIQKWWFEKKSGNAVYDQSAMRAIKKAEPLPPIPKELNKEILEFGIRFRPD
jgi:colicin import membrane protein